MPCQACFCPRRRLASSRFLSRRRRCFASADPLLVRDNGSRRCNCACCLFWRAGPSADNRAPSRKPMASEADSQHRAEGEKRPTRKGSPWPRIPAYPVLHAPSLHLLPALPPPVIRSPDHLPTLSTPSILSPHLCLIPGGSPPSPPTVTKRNLPPTPSRWSLPPPSLRGRSDQIHHHHLLPSPLCAANCSSTPAKSQAMHRPKCILPSDSLFFFIPTVLARCCGDMP